MGAQSLNSTLATLGWTGAELARRLGKGKQAVSAWRTGRTAVPKYVEEYLRVMVLAKEMLG